MVIATLKTEIIPKSKISSPTYGTRGFGIIIEVCPAYAINKGRAANDGSINFLLITSTTKHK